MECTFTRDGVTRESELSPSQENEFYYQMLGTTWFIKCDYIEGGSSKGGGVCLHSCGVILTAAHVVTDCFRISGTVLIGDPSIAAHADLDVIAIREDLDLALLRVRNASQKYNYALVSRDSDIFCGQNVFSIYHIMDEAKYSWVSGFIAYPSFRTMDDIIKPKFGDDEVEESDSELDKGDEGGGLTNDNSKELMQINFKHTGIKGASGCPVFDATGKLIGIIVVGGEQYVFAAPVTVLREFLEPEINQNNTRFRLTGERLVKKSKMECTFTRDGVTRESELSPSQQNEFYYQMLRTTWFIECDSIERGSSTGGGVCLHSCGVILTVAHVVTGCFRISGTVPIGDPPINTLADLDVIAIRQDLDLALLRVRNASQKYNYALVSRDSDIFCGQNVFSIYHILDEAKFSWVSGFIAYPSFRTMEDIIKPKFGDDEVEESDSELDKGDEGGGLTNDNSKELMQIDFKHAGIKGASGCPAFDATGKLIGIIVVGGEQYVFAAPVTVLREFLEPEINQNNTRFRLRGERLVKKR